MFGQTYAASEAIVTEDEINRLCDRMYQYAVEYCNSVEASENGTGKNEECLGMGLTICIFLWRSVFLYRKRRCLCWSPFVYSGFW